MIFYRIISVLLLSAILSMPQGWASTICMDKPVQVAFYDLGVLYNPKLGTGLDKDVVDEVFHRLACTYAPEFQSRVRIWRQLATGQLDMSVSGIPSEERETFAEFVPYFYVRNQLIYLDETLDLSSPDRAFKQKSIRIGVVKSYKHGAGWDDWIDSMRMTGRVEEAPDTRTLLNQLKGGRIQAFPALPAVIMDLGARYDIDAVAVRQTRWFKDQPKIIHGLILSKQRMPAELRKAIRATVETMRSDGSLLKIYRKYFDEQTAREMLTLQ